MPPHTHFPALPIEGSADAAVRVETYEDLACVDCAEWHKMLDNLVLPRFADRVAFVARDFPLEKHLWAEPAAMVSRRFASWDSAAGIEFRRFCLTRRADINLENFPERIAEFAELHGFDAESAVLSLHNDDLRDAVRRDVAEGLSRGVSKVPTVFVGETRLVESFTAKQVVDAIRRLLSEIPT